MASGPLTSTPAPVTAVATGSPTPSAAIGTPVKVLTDTERSAWLQRITGAEEAIRDVLEQGKVNVRRYQGRYTEGLKAGGDDSVIIPSEYAYTTQKSAQLFYRLPEVYLEPAQPGVDDACVVFQAALNQQLGPQGVNVLPRIQQVLFDVLCPVGFGAVKVGFQTAAHPTEPTVTDPITGIASPNLIARWYFIDHVSPGDLLVPAPFIGMDFDDAPWLGITFREDVPDGTPGTTSGGQEDERRLQPPPPGAETARAQQRRGREIWYRAADFDADVTHPDVIRTFRIYDDADPALNPITVTAHPFARYDATGALTNGMQGYPISPVVLRPIADGWLPPSECQMGRALADELSKGRTQMLQHRNRSMPQVGIDTTRVDLATQGKIQRNETGALIGFDGPAQDATWPIQKGEFGRENFTFNDYIQRDLDRAWGLGPNPGGTLNDTEHTASEAQIAQQASQSRLDLERNAFLAWYVDKVVTKFAALLQLFADQTQFVQLVGADAQRLIKVPGAIAQQAQQTGQDPRALVPWNKDAIQGRFLFRARPDSQLYLDTAQRRKQLMDLYNFFANNPTVNHQELTRQILSEFGLDPTKILQPPPPKAPEPSRIAVNVQANLDLNPFSPQYQNVRAMLQAQGVVGLVPPAVDPATANAMQMLSKGPANDTQHGGAAILAEKVSQHQADQTGGLQGIGGPAPIAPGGSIQ